MPITYKLPVSGPVPEHQGREREGDHEHDRPHRPHQPRRYDVRNRLDACRIREPQPPSRGGNPDRGRAHDPADQRQRRRDDPGYQDRPPPARREHAGREEEQHEGEGRSAHHEGPLRDGAHELGRGKRPRMRRDPQDRIG